MIPEIEVTCRGKRYFINSITVEQYKKYISLMEKNSTEKISGVMFFNTKIVQELFGNELTLAEIGEIDVIDFLTSIKTVHFVMQNIIAEKLLNIVEVEQVEKEKSAFDEYDRENGYEDEPEEPEESGGVNPAVLLGLLALIGGGGAFAYFKLVKNKPKTRGNADLDDYDYGDEEDSDEDEIPWESEDEDGSDAEPDEDGTE